MKSESDLE